MYAIIATGGKQYKVSEGDVIKVEKIDAEAGNTVTFDQVIAVSDNTLKVGADVANATVTATVMEQGRGKKVIVYKYKRKTGYHNAIGNPPSAFFTSRQLSSLYLSKFDKSNKSDI